jgi:NAD(P)H-flavin reductase
MSVKESSATIERVRRLSSRLQQLDLGVEDSLARLKPGQAVLARLSPEAWDPYLPEVWTPVALDGATVTVERPVGVTYTPGQIVNLLGPVGAPFPMRPNLRSLLLLALDTAPTPLILLATLAILSEIEVTLVLGGQARDYPLQALPPEIEVVEGDLEQGWPNQVTSVGWADQVIAVANPRYRHLTYPALLARLRQLRADIPKRFALGIFEQPMPCGVGTCFGCGVACKDGTDKLTCVDGPAIDLEEVNFG